HRNPRALNSRAHLPAPKVEHVGMNVVPARNLGNARLARKTLLDDPQLLSRRPAPSPLRARKNRNVRHVCPLTGKLTGKQSHTQSTSGRRYSPALTGGLRFWPKPPK